MLSSIDNANKNMLFAYKPFITVLVITRLLLNSLYIALLLYVAIVANE